MNNSLPNPARGADEQALYLYAILNGGVGAPRALPEATAQSSARLLE